jgi:hypothetical protein
VTVVDRWTINEGVAAFTAGDEASAMDNDGGL